jgi:hypothetical protein
LEGISEGDDIDMIEYDIEKEKDFQLSLLMNDNKLRNRLMLIYAKIEVILNSVEFADGGQTDDCMWRYENNEYTSRELIDLAEEMAEYDRQDTGEHIKINDVDSAIEYLGDVERIDIDDYPESMKYKTLGQRLLNREFGTIDLLLEESYQIPDLSPSGTYNKTMGKIQAIINEFNITENQFNKIASEYKSLDLVYSDFVNQDEDEYADGGDIPNNYEGLSEEDVWDMWTTQQKWHFLSDHADMFKRVKWGIEESFDRPIDYHDIAHSFSYQELPFAVKDAIRSHIEDGQYRKGGNVPSIEKKINELNKLISEANEKGVEVVDTDVTWQAPMKYKPIKYSNGVLYIEYEELDLYSHNRGEGTKWKTKKDKVFKNSGLGTYDQIAEINYIARMYRKAIKHFDKYGYADGGVNDTPSKKEMLDYLNMYFDYYSELRTIAVEEDNILTKRMLPTLDDEQIEMAYEDARYEVKSDTMYADGGELIDFEVGDYINWPSYHETDEFGNQFYETAKIVSIDGDEVTYEMNKYGDTYDFTFTIGDDFHKSIDHVEKMAEGGEVDIKDAVEEFVEELNNKYSDSYLFTLSFAKKYAKISHQPVVNGEVVQGKATWGFVALEDDNNKGIVIGDLLKAASVNTPAKGPRGNILKGDAQYDKYSPQYGKGWREEGGIMAKGGVVVSKLITDIKTALKDAEVRKLSDNRLRLDFYSKRAGDGKSVSKQNLLFIVDPQKEMIEFKNPDSYAKFETKYSSVRELSKFVKDSIRDWKQKDKAKYDQWKHNAWRNDRAYGGYMAKGGSVNLNQSYLSSSEFEKAKKLKDFNEEDWKWDSSKDLYAKVKKKITNKLHKFNVAANIRTSQGGRWDNHEVMARDEEEALMKVKKMYNPYGDSQFIMSNSFATKKMAKGGMTIDERMKAFKEYQQKWTTDMLRFLKGKKLGNLELINLQSEFNGIVEFSIQIDELKLNWMIKSDSIINFDEGTQKLIVYIGVNSPNRKGVFEKIVTGRNATNDMVWKTIQDIYNGKYKKMVKGGPTFDDKVDAISKALVNRKKVPKSVQKDYGKTYSKKESIESAKRIAGAMRKKEKMSRGGYVIRTKDRTIADDLLKYADLQEIPASQRKVGNIYVTKLDGKIEERSSMTSKFKDEVYPQFANYKKKS